MSWIRPTKAKLYIYINMLEDSYHAITICYIEYKTYRSFCQVNPTHIHLYVPLCDLERLPHLYGVVLATRSNATAIGRPRYSVYDVEVSLVGIKGIASRGFPYPDHIICFVALAAS